MGKQWQNLHMAWKVPVELELLPLISTIGLIDWWI
jgi:hypothetical protein